MEDDMYKSGQNVADDVEGALLLPCDVQKDDEMDAVFEQVGRAFGGLDALIHSVAYAPTDDLRGRVSQVSRPGFLTAMDISAYSLIAMGKRAEPPMQQRGGARIVAMAYL